MGRNPYEEQEQSDNRTREAEAAWLSTVREAAKHPASAKLLRWIFLKGGLHQSPFTASAEIYRKCGRLELALELRTLLKRALQETDRNLFHELTNGD